jgi:hypothetical protein
MILTAWLRCRPRPPSPIGPSSVFWGGRYSSVAAMPAAYPLPALNDLEPSLHVVDLLSLCRQLTSDCGQLNHDRVRIGCVSEILGRPVTTARLSGRSARRSPISVHARASLRAANPALGRTGTAVRVGQMQPSCRSGAASGFLPQIVAKLSGSRKGPTTEGKGCRRQAGPLLSPIGEPTVAG